MNVGGGEAADQMVRMMLSGTEVAVRLSGSALKNLLALTMALAHNRKTLSGKVNMGKMLKETRDLRRFPMTPQQYNTAYGGSRANTAMSNYHLRDKTLSLKAKGLLSLMLSLPETWDYTLAGLARISLEGKDAIRAAVVELEKAGYIHRSQTTDKAGKFSSNEYIIREYPASHEPSPEGPSPAQPLPENPTTAKPSTASTQTENPMQINKDPVKKEKLITDSVSTESFPFPSAPPMAPAPVQAQPSEAKGRKRSRSSGMSQQEMDAYRELIRESIRYDDFVREHPYDAGQLDEMVELMVEAVCSKKKNIRVAGNDFPQAVVKSRLLKLDGEHIRFVFDCLRENTTQVRNMKQYLLTVLYNAPVTIESHYAAQVNHDLYGGEAA